MFQTTDLSEMSDGVRAQCFKQLNYLMNLNSDNSEYSVVGFLAFASQETQDFASLHAC